MAKHLSPAAARISDVAAETIRDHNERAGWDIDDPEHGLGMMLTDLIVYARATGISFDGALATANETFGDCYDASHFEEEA